MKTMMNETPNEISTTNSRGNNKMKKFTKLFKNQKGLTLIELLAVIVILAIVAAIAVPSISGIIENSKYNAVKADATNVLNASQLYFIENPAASTVTVGRLLKDGFLENAGKIPATKPTTDVTTNDPTVAVAGESIVNKNGNEVQLTTVKITYSGKGVTFTNATIKSITADKLKGSTEKDKTITATSSSEA